MTESPGIPNPDLEVGSGNKQRWNLPPHRRHGFHNAHALFRQSLSMRSANVLPLKVTPTAAIATNPRLRELTGSRTFSGMVVARGDTLLFETYAPDFGTNRPHSIQSITKMHLNLIVGQLVADGAIALDRPVSHYLPGIGSGYAQATVQMLLDMNVANDFSEDYEDPDCDAFVYEVSLGWRLPVAGQPDLPLRNYLPTITGSGGTSQTGEVDYKSANTDVLAWIADVASGGELSRLLREIVEAAGYEDAFHISTDCEGMPALSGGGCMSARDLARFGLLFARRGAGINGAQTGCPDFIRRSLTRDRLPFAPPRQWLGYSNHLFTNGRWIGHGGYGGQFLMIDMHSGTVAAFLSVLENESGYDQAYMLNVIETLQAVVAT